MTDHYDIAIVGGGIHGVGVAQAAAAAGHSVLVIEARALAAGTSSRSSKLIHGGLRYLETGQLRVVRECVRERALLLRLAPALVRPQQFHLPIYRHTRRRPWQIRSGLSLYAALGGFRGAARFRRLPPAEWGDLDGLVTDDLQAVYAYMDAQTDDAALTRAVMQSALALGAQLAVPARFVSGRVDGGGVEVEYEEDGTRRACRVDALVNAAGPWASQVNDAVSPRPRSVEVELVQGAHVLLAGTLRRGIYYLEVPSDRRAIFAMPWEEAVLVGTTETPFAGNPDNVRPQTEEIAYLRDAVGRYFPNLGGDDEPLDAFAGLRVLPATRGAAFRRSRETIIDGDDPRTPRVITIYGGKLTAY
ncbi:MAG: FAD-dependent oxidoreductase, partial [Phycisphaerales bacterium]|nr:FAD-dependent oxidoreductase [Phycisphaerales bacterium]